MHPEPLTAIYQAQPAVRKVLDWIVQADVEDQTTTVEDLIDHCGISRRHAINLLRALAEAGYGEFKVGRKGHPSRFQWAEDPQALAEWIEHLEQADGHDEDEQPIAIEPPPSRPALGSEVELIEHSYVLRPKLRIALQLPEDLSAREAEILGDWIRHLSFER